MACGSAKAMAVFSMCCMTNSLMLASRPGFGAHCVSGTAALPRYHIEPRPPLIFVKKTRRLQYLFPARRASPTVQAVWRKRHQRSEEHTSELQSLMRISYAVFCLKKKKKNHKRKTHNTQ